MTLKSNGIADALLAGDDKTYRCIQSLRSVKRPPEPTSTAASFSLEKKNRDRAKSNDKKRKLNLCQESYPVQNADGEPKSVQQELMDLKQSYHTKCAALVTHLKECVAELNDAAARVFNLPSTAEIITALRNISLYRAAMENKFLEFGLPIDQGDGYLKPYIEIMVTTGHDGERAKLKNSAVFYGRLGELSACVEKSHRLQLASTTLEESDIRGSIPIVRDLVKLFRQISDEQIAGMILALLHNHLAKPFGEMGQRVVFDPFQHVVINGAAVPGDEVLIVREGWILSKWCAVKADVEGRIE